MNDLEGRLRKALHDETSGLMAHPTMAEDLVARGGKVRRRRHVTGGIACLAVVAALVPVWRTFDQSASPVRPVGHNPTVTTPPVGPTTKVPSTLLPPAWRQLPIDVSHTPKQPAHMVNVRVGQHATYDRVVIDFTGPLSGYRIAKVPRLVREGRGNVVRLPGSEKIVISLTPAVAHSATGQSLYVGPQRAEYGMPTLRGVAFLGDFEGVTVGLGVDHVTGVRVFELADPSRLVIDLHH